MSDKKLTYIQELELKKRAYHRSKHSEKYPNGVFSLQIRYGKYGYGKSGGDEERIVQLRWGIKRSNFYYSSTSFTVKKFNDDISVVKGINNSFKYVYNYSDIDSLIRKCKRAKVEQDLIDAYVSEFNKRGG